MDSDSLLPEVSLYNRDSSTYVSATRRSSVSMHSPIQSRVDRKKNLTEMDADLNNLQIISTARNINAADKTIMRSTENNMEVEFVSHLNIWNIYRIVM